ncbi:pyridoxine/pyridoxamine 5'-phosphate oxidase 2 isoform X1 [Physcomitrium patens]|uniref:pyridoxal 5'-phosphate synthase n=1 Tax=Physcomitrium patens TaxID=3218 RepID=A9SWS8_PHYPA|nr:pyridoxine/pyridoxamine 5'-phosphate oxidase 2-like isoform X1 [Physcomitrium patens]XP_024379696.1 pyridoxine/pyridoxamine 5'-phosphate oxidase 2-like isoform X1 [Physcomitrium patens]PNR50490.1 hypothetical protein PHYPA_009676 [Physcomitrium patens]|eukprot:XP_024379695.1 pyridoxine/pyridoxamine 5'-phosphate oxidase 2-like isoform X1 [Physcomitrella patens]
MATSPWRELLQQAMQSHKHLKHSTHLQLATVRPDGRPANRTLIFRGFVEGSDKLQFTTDSRTHKIEDIKHSPFGEICYHFTNSWEQFRIHGTLDLIGHADYESARKSLREKAWFDSSPRARAAFAAPHPGHPKGSEPSEGNLQVDPNQGPLDTFCVLTLDPEEIDYYHAKDAVRILFKSSTTEIGHKVWSQQELNP